MLTFSVDRTNCLEIFVSHSWGSLMLTSSTSIVNLIHKGHLDIHDSQGPNFASLDLFDEFFKVLIPLPVETCCEHLELQKKGLLVIRIKLTYTKITFKKKTDPWYEVSYCIIMSLSLERCSHILLGISRVALENHSKSVAFLWKPPRYGCGWMWWTPGRPSVARTTEVANKRSNKLTLYAWCQRLGWKKKKGEDIQILSI